MRRHRDGTADGYNHLGRWDWVRAPCKADREAPAGRYQHSSIFVNGMLLIIGGRTNNVGETLPIDVYDTESSEWTKFNSVQRFRLSHTIQYNIDIAHGSSINKYSYTVGSNWIHQTFQPIWSPKSISRNSSTATKSYTINT